MPDTFDTTLSPPVEFSVEDDLSRLEIRVENESTGFSYFFDPDTRRVVRDFVLEDRPQVATLCEVTLLKRGDRYSPRLRLWKRDKTKKAKAVLEKSVTTDRLIKAAVDTGTCNESFWKLVDFLTSLRGMTLAPEDSAAVARSLQAQDKETITEAVRILLGSSLTEADLNLMANRKGQLDTFAGLLEDTEFFDAYRVEHTLHGREAVWQHFFESNQWIFGYGLSLVACEALVPGKLERITTGAHVFGGAGKRSDAALRSKGYVGSLLFAEIKTHETKLLEASPYRPPDVYQVSKELSGGLSQVQKTAAKAVREIADQFHRIYEPDGSPTDIQVSTIRPRQILVIGSMREFESHGGINPEMSMTFELYRRAIKDVEILTFDELYQRARFIVGDQEPVSTPSRSLPRLEAAG